MTNLTLQIKEDHLNARKNGNRESSALLSTLLSETQKQSKLKNNIGADENKILLSVIQKTLKTINENLELDGLSANHKQAFEREKIILESYLPKQLGADEIETILQREFGDSRAIKVVMPFFKQNYDGQYNAKQLAAHISKK